MRLVLRFHSSSMSFPMDMMLELFKEIRNDVKDIIRKWINSSLSRRERQVNRLNLQNCDTLLRDLKHLYQEKRIAINDEHEKVLRELFLLNILNTTINICPYSMNVD